MLSIAEAQRIILDKTPTLPAECVALDRDCLGRVIADDQFADRDSPPFDKSMMDGIAVRSDDASSEFQLIDTVIAGDISNSRVEAGMAMRIMTGAPIPNGADAVVPVEQTENLPGNRIRVTGLTPQPGKHILRRGSEYNAGEIILPKGTSLSPPVLGLLAGLGVTETNCHRQPRVGIISTGNEIVEANRVPVGAQIRNSNGPMLTAQVDRAGGLSHYMGITADNEKALGIDILHALSAFDMLVISGGVSMGTHDLIPKMLVESGVEILFHKVAIKPGKPFLFGKRGDKCVFGLPGNPVSSFVGFELFVRAAIRKMRGERHPEAKPVLLPLAETLITDNDRPTYLPGRLEVSEGRETVRPIPWAGSANLLAYRDADALIGVPLGKVELASGQLVPVHRLG